MGTLEVILQDAVMSRTGMDVAFSEIFGKGKTVGFYASGSWCPPCKYFTPKLIAFYKSIKSSAHADKFEIVFISFDSDADAFEEHFSHMPWLAIKFAKEENRYDLTEKLGIAGIPCLVFVDGETGAVISRDGRSKVAHDPEGKNFPWRE